MAFQIKSLDRGTKRFQVSGIQESLYRAYTLVARRRRMSLNALLQEAVADYMASHHNGIWELCAENEEDDQMVMASIVLPVYNDQLEAEVRRRVNETLKAKAG